MYSLSTPDPEKNEDRWFRAALAFIIAFILALLVFGCSPRIIERVVTQRDTTYITRSDSVRFYDRDSVFIREKGDTIYQYVEKWRYRDRVKVDTLLRVRVDSVAVERIKEVPVEKPLTWWQTARIRAFWWLLGAVIVLLLWIFRKPLLKLIGL